VLYHVANTAAHGPILQLLARHPGIVVLHDFALSEAVDAIRGDIQLAHGWTIIICQTGRNARKLVMPYFACWSKRPSQAPTSTTMQGLLYCAPSRRSRVCWLQLITSPGSARKA
jgi:hypothetical protein